MIHTAMRLFGMGLPAVLLLGHSVFAQEQATKPVPAERQARLMKQYPEMDADKDGTLTRDEIQTYMAQQHTRSRKAAAKGGAQAGDAPATRPAAELLRPDPVRFLKNHPDADIDKDGKLTPRELRAYMQAHGPELRAELLKHRPELDTDKDGVLSEEEFRVAQQNQAGRPMVRVAEMVLKRFPESDSNKDGTLSPEELRTYMQTHGAEVRAAVLKKNPKLDQDGDGVLSPEEFRAAMQGARPGKEPVNREERDRRILRVFPQVDTDQDGKLSDEEFKAWRKQNAEQGPAEKAAPAPRKAKKQQPQAEQS